MKTLICFLAFAVSLAAQTYVDAMFPWPNYRGSIAGTPLSMGTDEMVAVTVTAKKACTLQNVHFNLTDVTSAQSITVTLQDVDSSGFPDGTADQTATVATPATGWNLATMGANRTVAAGDRLAVRFAWTSTAGSITFTTGNVSTYVITKQGHSFLSKYSSSAWAQNAMLPIVGLECSDGTFMPVNELVEPATGALVDFSSSSNPDEIGNRIQVPFGAKACGVTWYGRFTNTSAAADLVLYDASMNSLASCSMSGASTYSATGVYPRSCYFSSQQTLAANTTYYLMIKPTTTNTVRHYNMTFPETAALQAASASGAVYKAYRTDGGSVSTTNTERASVSLEICSIASGSTSGGASAHTWVQ